MYRYLKKGYNYFYVHYTDVCTEPEETVTDTDDLNDESNVAIPEGTVEHSVSKVTLMPEYLVVCCWRSIKEISLLLGQIIQTMPLGIESSDGLLDPSQVLMWYYSFHKLKLHSCSVYFIQKINPWRMVFYFYCSGY